MSSWGKFLSLSIDPFSHVVSKATGLHSPLEFATNWGKWGDYIESDWRTFKHWLVPDMRRDREIMTDSALTSRRIIYGRTRVSGALIYAETTGSNSEYLHLVVALCNHTCDGMESLYLDDRLVTEFPAGVVYYEFFDGTQTEACATLVTASAGTWTAEHKLLGVTYLYLRLMYSDGQFSTGIPTPKVVLRGKNDIYDPRGGSRGAAEPFFARTGIAYDPSGAEVAEGEPRFTAGRFGGGLVIEEGTANKIVDAMDFSNWSKIASFNYTTTQNQIVAEWGCTNATRITTIPGYQGANTSKMYAYGGSNYQNTNPYTTSVWVKNIGTVSVRIADNLGTSMVVAVGESKRVVLTANGNTSNSILLYITTLVAAVDIDVIVWHPQIENKPYATTFQDNSSTRNLEVCRIPVTGLYTASEGTIAGWFYHTHNGPSWTNFVNDDTSLNLFCDTTYGACVGGVLATSAVALVPGWSHLAMTWSGGTVRLYRNGVQIATATGSITYGVGNQLWVGKHWSNDSDGWLNGIVSDLRIYDTAMSAYDISIAANAASLLSWDESATVYTFDRILSSEQSYSNNTALCLLDYTLLPETMGGMGCTQSEVDFPNISEQADLCDELVASDSESATEPRYTVNGVIDIAGTPASVIRSILTTCAGEALFSQSQWRFFVAAYSAPTGDVIDETWLNGGISFNLGSDKNAKLNTVAGAFVNPSDHWSNSGFPVVQIPAYLADDGEELSADMQMSLVTSPSMAQRLARLAIERSRRGMVVQYPCNFKAFEVAVNQVVRVSNALLGWDEKEFRVLSWEFSATGGVVLSLGEEDESIYTWLPDDVSPLPLPPLTNLPSPWDVATPTGLTITESLYSTNVASQIKARATLNWTAAANLTYDIESWGPLDSGYVVNGTNVTAPPFVFDDLKPGGYLFRIRARNKINAASEYATLSTNVLGKLAAPPDVDTFLVNKQPDGTREFSWTHPSAPLDLAGYRIRYASGSSGTWEAMSELHTGLLLASPFESNQLSAGEYTFAICAEDTSGILSGAKYITLTLDNPRMAGVALSASFGSMGWPGAKTDCYIDDLGQLVAKDSKDWADFAADGDTWADWTSWNRSPITPIIYEHAALDIGAVTLFTPLVTVIGDGTATVTIAYSNDNVTYTSFAAIPSAPISARYIKVKVSMAHSNPMIRAVVVYLSAQQITEEINDYTSSSGDFRLPIAKTYSAINTVQITLQNVGAGWSWELIDKNSTLGPRVKIYNSSNTLAAATIDASIKGL